MKATLAFVAILTFFGVSSAMAETLSIRLDKAEVLRLDAPASIIVVGNPSIADVTVENPTLLFLTGLTPGETNLVIFDDLGDPVAEYDLIVLSEVDRHVTVHRNVDVLTTFSCKPRCIEVANPSEIERQRQFSDSGDEDELDPGAPAPGPDEAAGTPAGGASGDG